MYSFSKSRFVLASVILTLSLLSAAAAQNGTIVFTSNDTSGNWQIFSANPDGSNRKQISHLPATDLDSWVPSISPDGQKVAFNYGHVAGGVVSNIFVINMNGTGLRQVTHHGQGQNPRWSPDGTQLIYARVSQRSGAGVITVVNEDGTGSEQTLTDDLFDNFGAFYSPDGSRIFYYSAAGGYVAAVWVMNADGTDKKRLTEAEFRGFPTGISPDGQHVLVENNQNSPAALTNDIFVMNPDGTERTQLTQLQRRHHHGLATYSPDGSAIAFQSDFEHPEARNQFGEFDIFTMNADGTNLQRVIKNAGNCPGDGNCVTPYWGPTSSGQALDDSKALDNAASAIQIPRPSADRSESLRKSRRGVCQVSGPNNKLTGACVVPVPPHLIGCVKFVSDPAQCRPGAPAIKPVSVVCGLQSFREDQSRPCAAAD
jgi:Tol biopolymer transport system component